MASTGLGADTRFTSTQVQQRPEHPPPLGFTLAHRWFSSSRTWSTGGPQRPCWSATPTPDPGDGPATGPGYTEPSYVAGAVSDQMGGIILCLGVVSALRARELTGVGQRVDVSHLSATMWLQGLAVSMHLLSGFYYRLTDRAAPMNPLVNAYECADGRWIQFMSAQFQRYWPDFATALGLEEYIDHPLTAAARGMSAGSPELTAIIAERFKTKPVDEWMEVLGEYDDLIFAKVQTVEELRDDPQVIANNYITDFAHPVIGDVQMCNFPVTFSETPAGVWKEAPELGQDTEALLIEELGYDWDDIGRLQEAGAIL